MRTRLIALFLFVSGGCALIFQIAWLRELRLVFGASTYASAAVLAIFMGGLGLGGARLGRLADRHPRPLRLYGLLELGIAAAAFVSPFLLLFVRWVYLAGGGSSALGQTPALAVRLLLATLVLGLPTFLMGGTLPAAVKAVTEAKSRRFLALFYGVNTLGAVCGALLATFVLLEIAGTRLTILLAAAVNAGVGWLALAVSGGVPETAERAGADACAAVAVGCEAPLDGSPSDGPEEEAAPTRAFVFAAACILGFVFFLMEIVWYRMLSPLLGGTTYTFGLILAVALFGIGAGGLAQFFRRDRGKPSLRLFSATCALEALGLALAYGLGDRVAVLAVQLKPQGYPGLGAQLPGWLAICALVVLPAAVVSGYQFPLLVGLLGRGRRRVSQHTGTVYAWNTAGAIAGAVAGGFGLLPALGALGCWRLAVGLLVLLCALALAQSAARESRRALLVVPAGIAIGALALLLTTGPTAAWRHSQITLHSIRLSGFGANAIRNWLNEQRFNIIAEWDGIESSIGLNRGDGLAFVVNGKVDGNARYDSGTQIMAPLIGAILHPAPRKGMVIGLGTGTSAGWLAAVDTIERVDVAELEPAILEVARRCAPVNRDALANPKVRVIPGDGRELLMTSRERYDVIMSEPSNPYRAGIASLYTREFYQAVAARLAPGGIFSQWVQAYDVDEGTIRLIRATLTSVFADVQAWQTNPGDLLFTCTMERPVLSAPRLRERLAVEPFRSALLAAWGVTGLEGFLSSYIADDSFLRAGVGSGPLNTDDRMLAEFRFARGYAVHGFVMSVILDWARAAGARRATVHDGSVDWERVDNNRLLSLIWQKGVNWGPPSGRDPESAYRAFVNGDFATVLEVWQRGSWKVVEPLEILMLATAMAKSGDDRARSLLPQVRGYWPASAAAIETELLLRQKDVAAAFRALADALRGLRAEPWNLTSLAGSTLALAQSMATEFPDLAPRIFTLLEEPFSVRVLDADRIDALLVIARELEPALGVQAIAQLEPNVFWRERFLRFRLDRYERTGNALAGRARRDLNDFLKAE